MKDGKLTQADIARMTGFHKPNISEWLSGKVVPRLDTALRVSKVCNIPVDVFVSKATQMAVFGKVYLKRNPMHRFDDDEAEDEVA